ncbi:hypothetical protein DFR55_13111 [Herbinix hemicellulosilytica]|uniref:Putative membrane protein n=1 Tax=Herbinix hemicellulosilytica TaxID=1564487 RepID=A0A0H5SGH8_HERHM|nr:DUF2304 domain-containing protein [Herbinix hemicellulosilytica]RBP56997.1 hypothetical protein DFR55_13111 [Herbinix hemicellulosilytica]CRZ34130.1 putative membrane protein [Herbinix hemicellulosilytica]
MSISLRLLVCLAGIIFIYMARKANIARKMTEKQSLFWIIGGMIIFTFGLIPKLVYFVSDIFSVEYPPSIIFAISIILVFFGIFNCYKTNAELTVRVQELAMQISLLNDENQQLKGILNDMKQNETAKNSENLIA